MIIQAKENMPDPGVTQQVVSLTNLTWGDILGVAVVIAIALMGYPGIYNKWVKGKEEKDFISQMDSSIRDALALLDSGEHTKAINRCDGILKTISPQKYPNQWGKCQKSIGVAYCKLASISNKELNIKSGIQACDSTPSDTDKMQAGTKSSILLL